MSAQETKQVSMETSTVRALESSPFLTHAIFQAGAADACGEGPPEFELSNVAAELHAIEKLCKMAPGERTFEAFKKAKQGAAKGHIPKLPELVSASTSIALSLLDIPKWFATLEDMLAYQPSKAQALRAKAVDFQELSSSLLAIWSSILEGIIMILSQKCAKEPLEKKRLTSRIITELLQKTRADLNIPRSVVSCAFFLTTSAVWMRSDGTRKDSRREKSVFVLRKLAKISQIETPSSSVKVKSMFAELAKPILRQVLRMKRREKEDLILFGPLFRAVVSRVQHPELSNIFGDFVLPDTLRLIDQTHLPTKALGLQVLAHSIPELLLTEIRFHGPIILDRISRSMAFHEHVIEKALFPCIVAILPRLDPQDMQTRRVAMEVLKSLVKQIEWMSFSVADEPLQRVKNFTAQLPTRLAMSSTNRVVENAMESLTALIRAIPARAKAHQIKIFELTARVCIRHRPPKERKAGDDTERPEVAKSRSENERIRKLAVGVLAVLRETVGEKDFNADIIIQAQKRIPELAGMFSDLGSENAEQGK
eukprot:jgi/Bigna1/70048/fgenesh1_pg.10_\